MTPDNNRDNLHLLAFPKTYCFSLQDLIVFQYFSILFSFVKKASITISMVGLILKSHLYLDVFRLQYRQKFAIKWPLFHFKATTLPKPPVNHSRYILIEGFHFYVEGCPSVCTEARWSIVSHSPNFVLWSGCMRLVFAYYSAHLRLHQVCTAYVTCRFYLTFIQTYGFVCTGKLIAYSIALLFKLVHNILSVLDLIMRLSNASY